MPSSTTALDVFARYGYSRPRLLGTHILRMTRETPDCAPVVIPRPSINNILPPELLISVFDVMYLDTIASISFPPQQPPVDCHPLLEVMREWAAPIGHENEHSREVGHCKAGARSGTPPLTVTIAPERLVDFPRVVECLDRAVYRLDTLNIIPMYDIPQGWCSHVGNLFERSFPTLQRLSVGNFVTYAYPRSLPLEISVNAPELQNLSCRFHLVTPLSPHLLTSLSLTAIEVYDLEQFLSSGCIQLPRLLDLRLDVSSDAGQFLSTFSTPSLQKLTVLEETPSVADPRPLSQYPLLEELQWSDTGYTPTLPMVLARCPNLIRFANYLAVEEDSVDFQLVSAPATIVSLLENNADPQRVLRDMMPKLEEVRLAIATCEEIDALVEGIPSIKRIRILKSGRESEEWEDLQAKTQLLSSLAEKVEFTFGVDLWRQF
ncbi:hypothetical protein FS837_011295 [Tulasnella sp. UAMH 9824]|nr:hypothetical protein FS837_011295 [Tulasnella sp. UAMH 9824]